jgi:hypothetical protein
VVHTRDRDARAGDCDRIVVTILRLNHLCSCPSSARSGWGTGLHPTKSAAKIDGLLRPVFTQSMHSYPWPSVA